MQDILKNLIILFLFDLIIIEIFKLIFDLVRYKIEKRKLVLKIKEEILRPQSKEEKEKEE